ncbi:hypothetical protein C8R46DRAFT_850143, partial [Mycena filopes]
NVCPSLRIEATRTVVFVLYEPVACKPLCRAILNPYGSVSLPSCPRTAESTSGASSGPGSARSAFPPHYKDISNTNLPAELLPKYTTIEYT